MSCIYTYKGQDFNEAELKAYLASDQTLVNSYRPQEERIGELRPDYVLILAWNIKEEVMEQLSYVRNWGGRFVVPIPEIAIC